MHSSSKFLYFSISQLSAIGFALFALICLSASPVSAQMKIGSNPTTITAATNLEIEGTGSVKTVFLQNGKVGIGTTGPAGLLSIQSDAASLASAGDQFHITRYDGNGGYLVGRSAGGTSGAPSATGATDALLTLQGAGYVDGAFTARQVDIGLRSNQAWTTSARGTYISFRTTPDNSTTIAEAMRITGSGNVGIGTVSPAGRLDVYGGSLMVRNPGALSAIELGQGQSSSQYAYIDLVGDTTYTDYGFRIIRNNGGANTSTDLIARGTGGIYIVTNDAAPIVFNTSATERMRIDSAGNVGIGTTAPTNKFGVNQSANATAATYSTYGIGLYNQGTVDLTLGSDATYSYIQSWQSKPLYVNSQGNNIILGAGAANVGIGTTAPGYKLDVNGIARVGGNSLAMTANVGLGVIYTGAGIQYGIELRPTTAGVATPLYFTNSAGASQGSVSINGSGTTSYNTTSDQRLKVDTGNSAKGLAALMNIQVHNFRWKQSGAIQDGFFAQELYQVFPDAVTPGSSELDAKGNIKNPWSVDYGKVTPLLVKSVQELKGENDALKARIEKLESLLTNK